MTNIARDTDEDTLCVRRSLRCFCGIVKTVDSATSSALDSGFPLSRHQGSPPGLPTHIGDVSHDPAINHEPPRTARTQEGNHFGPGRGGAVLNKTPQASCGAGANVVADQ